jgi:hypothetical protein
MPKAEARSSKLQVRDTVEDLVVVGWVVQHQQPSFLKQNHDRIIFVCGGYWREGKRGGITSYGNLNTQYSHQSSK